MATEADNMNELSDDIFSLLEIVQEKQDSEGEKGASAQQAGKTSAGSPAGGLSASSNDKGYDKLVGDLDEELAALTDDVSQASKRSIKEFDPNVYSRSQLDELEKGIEHNVDVSFYEDPTFMFRQMREIRLGLEQGVDVTLYANKYFKDKSMREVRLGLMEGVDAGAYARLIYSLPDMQGRHHDMVMKKYRGNPLSTDFAFVDRETGIRIYTEEGQMKAFVRPTKPVPDNFNVAQLDSLLFQYGISEGLCLEKLKVSPNKMMLDTDYLVAEGTLSYQGEDGYYEYLVENIGAEGPKVREDGSLDYRAQRNYASVKEGQKLALYHPATLGVRGKTVTGMELPAISGHNLPKMTARNIGRLEDGVTYVAQKSGFVTLNNGMLTILDILEFREDITYTNGNIYFDGNIQIYGSVRENSIVEAEGDITVNGFVESAKLVAGGNIIISGGVSGNGRGHVEAKGNVAASFYEHTTVVAGGDIIGGYMMNCYVSCEGKLKTDGKKSMIVGGKVRAINGLETGNLGNDKMLKTEVECGKMYNYMPRLAEIMKKKRDLEAEINKVKDGMNLIIKKFGAMKGRTHETYLKFQDILEQQNKKMNEIEAMNDELAKEMEDSQRITVKVHDMAYANVRININGGILRLNEPMEHVIYRGKDGVISSVSM